MKKVNMLLLGVLIVLIVVVIGAVAMKISSGRRAVVAPLSDKPQLPSPKTTGAAESKPVLGQKPEVPDASFPGSVARGERSQEDHGSRVEQIRNLEAENRIKIPPEIEADIQKRLRDGGGVK
jgi:hypothetical protein